METDMAATTVIATYRVKAGSEAEFEGLLARHWPTLEGVGLVSGERAIVYRGQDEPGEAVYYEVFDWKDAGSPGVAHETPAVMAIWEPMGALCEGRKGRPAMDFPHVERVRLEE
jgi:hypothetical protein